MKKTLIMKGKIRHRRNILIDLPHGLGDLIMCFPIFASLKADNPDVKITALSPNKASQQLLRYNKHIDETFLLPAEYTAKGLFHYIKNAVPVLRKKVKKEKYDLFIIVHPNIIRSINRILCGIRNSISNYRNIHKTSECMNILTAMGIQPVIDYTLHFTADTGVLEKYGLREKNYILLDYYPQYFDKDPRKWDRFDELVRKLKESGFITVSAGINPSHKASSADIDIVNKTSFEELLTIIASAKAAVTMDTGIFHLSYALSTPVVGLFGPVDPAERIPLNANMNVSFIYKKLACSPCIKNKVDIPCSRTESPYLCMTSIQISNVIDQLDFVIKRSSKS